MESSAGGCGGEEAVVEGAAGFDEPEQRFVGEREEGAAEDAGEADFVGRAGDGAEQVQDVEDFLLSVEGVATDDVVVEAVVAEGFFVDVDVAQRAEEDGDVAEFEPANAAWLLVGSAMIASSRIEELTQSASDSPRFFDAGCAGGAFDALVVFVGRDRPEELDGRFGRDLRSMGPQGLVLVVEMHRRRGR